MEYVWNMSGICMEYVWNMWLNGLKASLDGQKHGMKHDEMRPA